MKICKSLPLLSEGYSMASVANEVALHATARAHDFAQQTRKLDEFNELGRAKNTKKGSGVESKKQSDITKHVQMFNKPRSPFRRRKK